MIITDLNSISCKCGHFTDTPEWTFGCKHPENDEGDYFRNGYELSYFDCVRTLARSFSKNKVTSRRKAKKFIKKARQMPSDKFDGMLKKRGIEFRGKCFPYSCPIACDLVFEDLEDGYHENRSDYDYIKTEKDMPWGWGDDLMGITTNKAKELNINY